MRLSCGIRSDFLLVAMVDDTWQTILKLCANLHLKTLTGAIAGKDDFTGNCRNLFTRSINMPRFIVFVAVLFTVAVASACEPPDCDNVDRGTCVQACCKLQFDLQGVSAKKVSDTIAKVIDAGGPDG